MIVLVTGGCPNGADATAARLADRLGWQQVEQHPGETDRYGWRAHLGRTAEMVARGASLCLAFSLDASRGTAHCTELAGAARIPSEWMRPAAQREAQ